jgi:hypothetical protein
VLLDWAASEPSRGVELLPMIESSWLRAIEIGERPELQDTVRGRGSFLAAHNLAVLQREPRRRCRGHPLAPAGAAFRAAAWRLPPELAGGAASFPAFARRPAAYPSP